MNKFLKCKLFILLVLTVFFVTGNVYADSAKLKIEGVTINEKSSTVTATTPTIDGENLNASVVFNEKDDYIVYEISLKNIDDNKWKINDIEDNNTSDNLKIDYEYDKNYVGKNEIKKIKVRLSYKEKLVNTESINIDTLKISVNLVNDKGEESEIIINPGTGDGLIKYIVLLTVSVLGIILSLRKKIIKKVKVGGLLLIIAVIMSPFVIFASEKYALKLNVKAVTLKSEMLPYEVSFNTDGGTSIGPRTVKYGDSIGELPTAEKRGYTFNGWKDGQGNSVTSETKVTGTIELIADYTVKEYYLHYNLDKGTVSPANPTKYTVEDDITLNNPTRKGYTFAGWTEGSSETLQTSVRIYNEIDEKTFTAHWSAREDTPYRVIHQYRELNGSFRTVTQNLTGATDTTVTPGILSETGFIDPELKQLKIETKDGDEVSTLTYTYERIPCTLTITNSEYVETETPSDSYPYGTEITLTAKTRDGYTFSKWSNNITTNSITFTITGNVEIGPEYTKNKYKVTFNPNGGLVSPEYKNVTVGSSVESLPTPEKADNVFAGWYTDQVDGTEVSSSYTPAEDVTIYAHWEYSPTTFTHEGACTFNGQNGVITGNNCRYAGQKFINTGVQLYRTENHSKDYEIGFTIDHYSASEQDSNLYQQTLMNTKLEGSNFPGLVLRRSNRDRTNYYELGSRKTSGGNAQKEIPITDVTSIRIFRIYNETTKKQEIYYSLNNQEKIFLNDLSQFNPTFNTTVWFGAAPTDVNGDSARRFLTGTLSNMYVKLGKYNGETVISDKYVITFDPSGGEVTPSKKEVVDGNQIGTLPTPTAPEGQDFDGWYTSSTGGTKVTTSYYPSGNITLYARYKTSM